MHCDIVASSRHIVAQHLTLPQLLPPPQLTSHLPPPHVMSPHAPLAAQVTVVLAAFVITVVHALLVVHVTVQDVTADPPSPPGGLLPSHVIAPHAFAPAHVMVHELASPQSTPPPHALFEQFTSHGTSGGQCTLFPHGPPSEHAK
jgi:hypothetical protein